VQTRFTLEQLADPDVKTSESIVRKCVHCGLCTATCPTFVLLGDELDSPRGRIYLIKDMLENARPASALVTRHIDRCLSCLSCLTTCPAGVNYMHLVDHARAHIEATYRRPLAERFLRAALDAVLPSRGLFRAGLIAATFARPVAPLLPARLRALVRLAPRILPRPMRRARSHPPQGPRRMRVALLTGCVQDALRPSINEATIRLLTRHGCEVVLAEGAGCCGALSHHLGKRDRAHGFARRNVAAWWREVEGQGLDAVIANASGCGTMLKDYGFLLRGDEAWAERAERIARLARDVSEVLTQLGLKASGTRPPLRVAYHSACSLQHGQRVHEQPKALLREAGFDVVDVPEGHLCCGSAGTYNLLQPEIAERLRRRKLDNIATTAPDLIAAGNIGCIQQLASGAPVPVLHTAELLDWASGGPPPPDLAQAPRRPSI
jgi:glycolate oxidase iron-sulfur subunit